MITSSGVGFNEIYCSFCRGFIGFYSGLPIVFDVFCSSNCVSNFRFMADGDFSPSVHPVTDA